MKQIYNPKLINAEAYKLIYVLMPNHDNDGIYGKYSPQFLAMIDDTAKKYNNKLLADLLKANALQQTLSQINAPDFYKNKAVFDGITESYLKIPLAKRYNLVKTDNNAYQVTVSSYSKRLEGTVAGKVIDSILAKHKNQVIYVDFWATWCSACIGEMPNSKKMSEKYKDKNVAFAYICLRSPKDLWKTVSARLGVDGDHIFCDENESKSIIDGLKIHGIPFYMLIDKNGQIIEAGDQFRPARYFTERKINTLLQ